LKKLYTQEKYKKQQNIQQRRALVKKSRSSKCYQKSDYPEYIKTRSSKIEKRKTLDAPIHFSLINNDEESLKFFDDFMSFIEKGYYKFQFDMKSVEKLDIEILLYIISLHKIYEKKINIQLKIKVPTKQSLKYIMIASGFSQYFKPNIEISEIDEENIFPICDGATNRLNKKDDGQTCAEAVDFAKKFFNKSDEKNQIFRLLYTSLAELMLNTDNHAYDEDLEKTTIDNWYLFAVKLDDKIIFYFFDNGKGITKTARNKIIDKAYGLINLEQKNILQSVLKGEFRSKTGIGHRGKGLPQINELLTDNKVGLSVILTNKVRRYYNNIDDYKKVPYDFRGSLFIWTLPLPSMRGESNGK